MMREKTLHDRKYRPQVDQGAAKRFVKSGLYDFKQKNEEFRQKNANKESSSQHQKLGEKRKFDKRPLSSTNPHQHYNKKKRFN